MIGPNKLTVKLRLNTLFRLVEINISPFEYIKLDRPIAFSCTYVKLVKYGVGRSGKRFEFVLQELLLELELKKGLKFERRAEDRSETSF